MNEEWLLCPECGWSGPASKLDARDRAPLDTRDAASACPACDARIRRD